MFKFKIFVFKFSLDKFQKFIKFIQRLKRLNFDEEHVIESDSLKLVALIK